MPSSFQLPICPAESCLQHTATLDGDAFMRSCWHCIKGAKQRAQICLQIGDHPGRLGERRTGRQHQVKSIQARLHLITIGISQLPASAANASALLARGHIQLSKGDQISSKHSIRRRALHQKTRYPAKGNV
jgi:hypothetical protein